MFKFASRFDPSQRLKSVETRRCQTCVRADRAASEMLMQDMHYQRQQEIKQQEANEARARREAAVARKAEEARKAKESETVTKDFLDEILRQKLN
jgi:hypothetical protein